MPLRTVTVHPLAARELRSAYRWYVRRSPNVAQRFQQALNAVVQRIASAAEQGSPYGQSYRWMRLRRFPYQLYYEIQDPQNVMIYACAHVRRRPGYWLRRTRP
jgi:plasmid stabilization system protein ParE